MPHRFFIACIITVAVIALGGFGFAETAEAATKYAVNAGGNWSADATWSTVSAKDASRVADTTAPTAADDVVLDDYSGNVTIATAAACRSIDMVANGDYAGVLNHDAGITLTIGDVTAGAGNVALKFTGTTTYTIDHGTTSAISFQSSSVTQQTIDFSGMNTGNVTFGATAVAGNYQLTGTWGTSAVNASQFIIFDNGTLDTNGQTCHWGGLYSWNSNTRILTFGASAIHLYKSEYVFYLGSSNITINGSDATIYFDATSFVGNNHYMIPGGTTIGTVIINGSDTFLFTYATSGTQTIGTLIRNGTASKTDVLNFEGPFTITNELRLLGNSATNRLLVKSNALGTPRTLTIAGATISNSQNVDFRDITFANGGADVDLSAITGGSGDAGGNSISGGGTLSFTAADDWYWYNAGAGTYNFSDYSHWYTASNGGGSQMASTRVVLPQDNAYFDASSVTGTTTVDQDMPRVCKTLDFTGVDPVNFHTDNIAQTIYGSFILSSNVTGISGNESITLAGRGEFEFKDAGSFSSTAQMMHYVSMVGGILRLTADFNGGATTRSFVVTNGTFDLNGYNFSYGGIATTGEATRSILLQSAVVTLGNYGGTWNMAATTGLTFDAGTSSIICTNTGGIDYFYGGDLTYNDVTLQSGATYNRTITGNNTFNTLTINGPKTVKFTDGTNTHVNSFVATGTAANPITITGTSTAGWTLTDDNGGTNTVDYNTISYGTAAGATWNAETARGNVDGGNNTGWIFDATAPSGGSITYTNGYFTAASIPITYVVGTDSGSGLNTASGKIQRASATLTSGSCGAFDPFADLVTEFDGAYTDATVETGKCYKYQYQISDTVPNTATYTSANVAKVDTSLPAAPGIPNLVAASDTGESSSDDITNDTTPSFIISCETDATVTIFSGSTALGNGTCVGSTVTVTASALASDGSYSVKAKQQNLAGVFSATGSALAFTLDTAAPTVSTLSPADNATGIAITDNLTITFDELTGKTGTGYVTIYKASDDSIVEQINTATGSVSGSGSATITIDLTASFANSTAYYVKIDTMAFPDSAGNLFAGIDDSTTWNFTTVAVVVPTEETPAVSPSSGGGGGHRGSTQSMAKRIAAAREQILARYRKAVLAVAPPSSSSSQGAASSQERETTVAPVSRLSNVAQRRGLLLVSIDQQEIIFRDVPTDSWFAPYVATLVDGGIAQGYSDTEGNPTGIFGVANPVTYAEILKMSLQASPLGQAPDPIAGLPPPRNASARGTWASAYVARAEELQLSVFRPDLDVNKPATRGAVMQILLEAMEIPIGPKTQTEFTDVPASHPYARAIATSAFMELVEGDLDEEGRKKNLFRPDAQINRAEVSKIIAIARELLGE